MSEYTLSQINIYPVKSLHGISLNKSKVEERGFQFDRRWMLVDNNNMFMTLRSFPQMVSIKLSIVNDKMIFSHPKKNLGQIAVSLTEIPNEHIQVQIWDDYSNAIVYGEEVNHWFSDALDFKCRLVYMPEYSNRKTSTKYFKDQKSVSFADGYPYLIIGEESLKFLNTKLMNPVKMERFRPNIVFQGGMAHEEDNWKEISIGLVDFTLVKPCSRCVITTIDPETGINGREPLITLNTYRNFENKIMFGHNTIAHNVGSIKVGEKINIRTE